jgi:heme oxygenase
MAENTGFVSCFLKGVVDKASYRTLVADLYFVYIGHGGGDRQAARCRPSGGGAGRVPRAQPPRQPSSRIWPSISATTGATAAKATPAAQEYVRPHPSGGRRRAPELLVGHHYTRYIGDLSGGQILKNIAQKAMNLGEHDGLRFYEFDAIPDEKGFKANYRSTLDNLPDRSGHGRSHRGGGQPRLPPEHEDVPGAGGQPGRRHRQGAVRLPAPAVQRAGSTEAVAA